MYENMLNNYRVFFKGMPEPVFYGHFLPQGSHDGPYRSSLSNELHYGRGLRQDTDRHATLLAELAPAYLEDLCDLLYCARLDTPDMRTGVVTLPAATAGVTNRVCELVRQALEDHPCAFVDLTHVVTRTASSADTQAAGSLPYQDDLDTIDVDAAWDPTSLDAILVVGDILTDGQSFRAMDDRLRSAGFAGAILNFALTRTYPSEGAICCWELERDGSALSRAHHRRVGKSLSLPVEGLIFGLDQTLLDDTTFDMGFEARLADGTQSPDGEACPYVPFEGIDALFDLCVPSAIVSDRPRAQLIRLLGTGPLVDALYSPRPLVGLPRLDDGRVRDGVRLARGLMPRNAFTYPEETRAGRTVTYAKPSPRGVYAAVRHLRTEHCGGRRDARIVGVGSTYEDIVAYGTAGIESALALWGVPAPLREHARIRWGADLVFEDPASLSAWVRENTRYHAMGVRAQDEGADPKRVLRHLTLAIQCADDAADSAYRCACLLIDDSPDEAAVYFERAIEAGDERLATNGLACLIAADDPERAAGLFERAIAAGDELHATYNLANLLAPTEPLRARELFERAIAAGDDRYATFGLANLACDRDPELAQKLLERAIAAGDDRCATNVLAGLVARRDPGRARVLLERAIAAGDERYATNNLADLIVGDEPERARVLFERAIEAGDERYATNGLADLIVEEEPERARDLYERAIAAGDERWATSSLADLIVGEDPIRAQELYERAVVAGDERHATNCLAQLIVGEEPERARLLFERAIAAGDELHATYNLAGLIVSEQPERAAELYERAVAAGDELRATYRLARLIAGAEPERARLLLERSIAAGDERRATNCLAGLIADTEPERARDLYERAIDAGDERYATFGLAALVAATEPLLARELYERAIAAGDEQWATFGLANLIAAEEPDRARWLYERAIEAGDERGATNNLASLIAAEDPERAAELYQRAIDAGDELYATNGLGYLIAADDPKRARELFERAIAAGDDQWATNNLADLIADAEPERARRLYERAIEAGNERWATNGLGRLIGGEEPERARELFERAIAAGDEKRATGNLADLIAVREPKQALELYVRAIAAGDELHATYGLAKLIAPRDPQRACGLYERAIAAGDELHATKELADLIAEREPERASELYERAIAAGDERYATYGLATLVAAKDPGRAIGLLERAVAAGDERYATGSLAELIAKDQPERSRRLYERAVAAGDELRATYGLASLLKEEDPARARELLERAVAAGDEMRATKDLADLIADENPERARRLYERAIAAGDERYATKDLADLISDEDPVRAVGLYERAIAAGDELWATNSLGILIAHHDLAGAIALFERAIAAGDMSGASCNLAHLIVATDPKRAFELYRQSARSGEMEAVIGLAYLLRDKDAKRSRKLLARARAADNRQASVRFLLEFMGLADEGFARDVAQFLAARGFPEAVEAPLEGTDGQQRTAAGPQPTEAAPAAAGPAGGDAQAAGQVRPMGVSGLNIAYRRALAARPDTAADVLLELARDEDRDVRELVAKNPSTSPEALAALAGETDAVAANPSCPPEVLEGLYHAHRAIPALAGNPSCPPATLERILLTDYRNVTPRLVSEIRRLDGPDLDLDAFAGERAARNPGMPLETLLMLMSEGCVWSYRYVACNPSAPEGLLENMSRVTLESLAGTPGFKRFVDAGMAKWKRKRQHLRTQKTPDQASIDEARSRYERGAVEEILHNVARNAATPEAILTRLATEGTCTLTLAENPNTPPQVLADLALRTGSDDADVLEALATNPNTPHDVLDNLASDWPSKISALVASNPSAPPSVVDYLADPRRWPAELETVDWAWYERVLTNVAGNPGAPEGALGMVLEYFSSLDDPDAHDRVDDAFSRLARNPATPRGVLMRLIKLDHRHLEEVLQNQGFDLMSLLANR